MIIINRVKESYHFAEMRKKRNLLQKDVASALGVDRSSVAKWETGESVPKLETLVRLSDLLFCSVDELLFGPVEAATATEANRQAV